MKTRNIVLRIFTMIFSVLMFVPMVTSFITWHRDAAGKTWSGGIKLSEWTESMGNGKLNAFVGLTKALYYIAFALAMVLIALEVVRFVLKKENKIVETCTKVCAILVLVLSILVFVLSFVWCMTNIRNYTGSNPLVYLPYYGALLTFVFGLVAGICGLKDFKDKKAK